MTAPWKSSTQLPKPVRMPLLPKVDRERIEGLLCDVEIAVYDALPTGNAKVHQMESIRTVMNHAMTGIHHRRKALDQEECEAALEVIYSAGEALEAAVKRHNRRVRKGDKDFGFVFKGDELNAIKDGVRIAHNFIKDSLKTCPAAVLKEFYTAQILDNEIDAGKITNGVSVEHIDAVVDRLTRTPTARWKRMAGKEQKP